MSRPLVSMLGNISMEILFRSKLVLVSDVFKVADVWKYET